MWEYKTEMVDIYFEYYEIERLNSLGREGWEVVGMTPAQWNDRGGLTEELVTPTVAILLKRRIST